MKKLRDSRSFMPKGMIIRNELENFWKTEHRKRGYEEIKTPLIMNEHLWRTSGHWIIIKKICISLRSMEKTTPSSR